MFKRLFRRYRESHERWGQRWGQLARALWVPMGNTASASASLATIEAMNKNGTPAALEPLRPANTFAVKSGIYSRTGRVLAPRAEEIARALMDLPHVAGADVIAAEEIGSVLATLEAIDRDLGERGVSRRGAARKDLLDRKARLSRELRTWLREFGATPASRASFAATLAGENTLAAEIRRRMQETNA